VSKKEFHTPGSKSLIGSQEIYRVLEMTEKESKTSYTDTSLFIPFIGLLNF
jgi:hypothetical protein